MRTVLPVCYNCVHYFKWMYLFRCEAFPEGIPRIVAEGNPHIIPIDGDNGIMSEAGSPITEPPLKQNECTP